MKYIIMLMPIAAVWLLSANEQGLIGSWAVWTSLALAAGLAITQVVAGRVK